MACVTASVGRWTYLLNQTLMITQYLRLAVWPRSLVLARSRSNSSSFGCSTVEIMVTPVMLPPGRLRLETRPISTGSEPVTKYEFARRVASEFGYDAGQVVSTRLTDAKLKAARPRNTSLNTSKICNAMGRTMPNVDAGLRRFRELRESGYVDRIKGDLTGVRP